MQVESTSSYKFSDSAKVFLWAVIAPQIVALIFIMIISFASTVFNLEYEVVLSSYFADLFIMFLAQIAFFAVFFTYNNFKKINWKVATKINVKINLKQVITLILIAVTSLFFLSPLISLLDYLISLTGYSASSELPINLATIDGLMIGILALAVFPAVAEELIFRGVIYNGLKSFGYKKAILISSLLFALMHMSIQQTFYQIIIGAFLAYSLYITGSLLAPIVMHFANNFLIIMLTFFAINSGIDTSIQATFSSVSDYLQVVIYTVVGVVILWQLFIILKNQSRQFVMEEVIFEPQAILEQDNDAQLILAENIQIVNSLEEVVVEGDNNIENMKAYKTLSIAVMIGIVFWLLDLFSNIPK